MLRDNLFVVLLTVGFVSYASTAPEEIASTENASKLVDVQVRFCEAKPQKPPLEKLYFRVSFHNLTS